MTKQIIGHLAGSFSLFHNGHVFAIEQALKQVDILHVFITADEQWEQKRIDPHDLGVAPVFYRARMISQEFKDHNNLFVHIIKGDKKFGNADDWKKTSLKMLAYVQDNHFDKVFSSESSYEARLAKLYPDSEIITFKRMFDISSTKIFNEGIYKHWNLLPRSVRAYYGRKIVICGPESVGKSTLTKKLCRQFDIEYLPEGGRIWWEFYGGKLENVLDSKDYLDFSYWRMSEENRIVAQGNKINIFDTGAETTAMWISYLTEMVEDYPSQTYDLAQNILENIFEQEINNRDLYLLISPEKIIPTQDGMRLTLEELGKREKVYNLLKKRINESGANIVILDGDYEDNYLSAIEQVKKMVS